jgi:hypothetical protein
MIAPAASYVGEGELGADRQDLPQRVPRCRHAVAAEITLLAQKAGVPRMRSSISSTERDGSVFSRYKTPAFVNLRFQGDVHAVPAGKDMDLASTPAANTKSDAARVGYARLIQSMMGNGMTERTSRRDRPEGERVGVDTGARERHGERRD